MAGKTVAKAAKAEKAAVKKVDGKKAAKPVAVVKKADGVKKPVSKKPNVGTKFNLHKLIMLIIRDAPKAKKGNKMTGGYDDKAIETNILKPIQEFIHVKYNRIATILKKLTGYGISNPPPPLQDIHQFIEHINKNKLQIQTQVNNVKKTDKDVYERNLMNIVIMLCVVFCDFKKYSSDFAKETRRDRYDIDVV
jgi:hypothetical protein